VQQLVIVPSMLPHCPLRGYC